MPESEVVLAHVRGALIVPRAEQAIAGVVFLGGSGPVDRDSTIGLRKPLRDLAWGLAARGIASLRFDKRTYLGDRDVRTVEEEVLADAREAIARLAREPGVDASKIFLVGHSLGGMLVPRLLATTPGIRGAVMLAAPSRPLHVVLIDQLTRYGGSPEMLRDAQSLAAAIEHGTLGEGMYLGAPRAYWLDLAAYDAAATLRTLDAPVVLFFAGADVQVTADDERGWRTGLPHADIRTFAALDHLFMHDGEHVDAAVIAAIANWIAQR
ncbi:MAG TPA: alpha/beta fold hydrolase [Thermoanaerobaculia bacterium]